MVRTFTTSDGVQHCYGCARPIVITEPAAAAAAADVSKARKSRSIWLPRVKTYLLDMSSIAIDSACVSMVGGTMTAERVTAMLHAFDTSVVPYLRDTLVQTLLAEVSQPTEDAMATEPPR